MKARLLLPDEYLHDATKRIGQAREHIGVLTMIVSEDEKTRPFIDALCAAAERGVSVTVAADMFTYAEIGGHFKFNNRRSTSIRPITAMESRLRASGVKFRWLGTMASSLVSGRTHTKWLVIDDEVYTFGGVNLYGKGMTNTDYMLHMKDIGLAAHLLAEQRRILQSDHYNQVYRAHKFGDDTDLVLIDGGLLGDSIIYRHACKLATHATKVTYVSQYCPTGKLGRLLKKTNATLYFNPWNKADSLNALTIRVGTWLSGHQTDYTRDTYLHAKLMLFEMPNGVKIALTGSHNFSHGGVWLGTREIALETKNPQIIKQLETFVRKYVA